MSSFLFLPPDLPNNPSPLSFKFMPPFQTKLLHCIYVYIYIYTYTHIYIPKYKLLSSYNVACVCNYRVDCHWTKNWSSFLRKTTSHAPSFP